VRTTLWRYHLGGGCVLALAYVYLPFPARALPAVRGRGGGRVRRRGARVVGRRDQGRRLGGRGRPHHGRLPHRHRRLRHAHPGPQPWPGPDQPDRRHRDLDRRRHAGLGVPGRPVLGRRLAAAGRAGPVDAVRHARRAHPGPGHPDGDRHRRPQPGLPPDDHRLAGPGGRRRRAGPAGAAGHLRPLQPRRGRLAGRLRPVGGRPCSTPRSPPSPTRCRPRGPG
jgi:hypothetical protein